MNIISKIVGTGELGFGNYIALGLISLIVLNALVSVMYPLVVNFYNIAFREEKDFYWYANYKLKVCFDEMDDLVFSIALFDILIGALFCLILSGVHLSGNADLIFTVILTVVTLLYSPYVLRYIVDMSRTLQMNKNTGDSERLKALEKEIKEIKKRV